MVASQALYCMGHGTRSQLVLYIGLKNNLASVNHRNKTRSFISKRRVHGHNCNTQIGDQLPTGKDQLKNGWIFSRMKRVLIENTQPLYFYAKQYNHSVEIASNPRPNTENTFEVEFIMSRA